MKSKGTRCLSAVLLFSVLSIPSAHALSVPSLPAPSVTRLVVFGDSNVDIGRVAAEFASGQFDDGVLPPPNTVNGRSSDGSIIPEYVADRVGIPQLNFAYGGATSGATNILGSVFPDLLHTGTLSQLDEFEARLDGAPADPTTLYLIWAGSNDLLRADKNDQAAVDAAVDGAIANLTLTVERLTALGARHIVVATRTSRPVLSDAATPSVEANPQARDDAAGRQVEQHGQQRERPRGLPETSERQR